MSNTKATDQNLQRGWRFNKTILLFFLSLFLYVLWLFTDYHNSTMQLLDKWRPLLLLGHLLFPLLGIGLLYFIGRNDFGEFYKRMLEQKHERKGSGELILLLFIASYPATWLVLHSYSQHLGYCKIPTIYDLLAERSERPAPGLGNLLAQRRDLGCGWQWGKAFIEAPNFTFPGANTFMSGEDQNGDTYYIEQIIGNKDLYSAADHQNSPSFEGEPLEVDLPDIPQATSYDSKCIGDQIIKECSIVIGLEHIIYAADVRTIAVSDPDRFEEIVNIVLVKATDHILQYEATLNSP